MEETIYKRMGAKIRYYRQLKDLNQTQFAEIICISPQYLSKIEYGKRVPSVEILISIAKALDVDISELLSGKDFI